MDELTKEEIERYSRQILLFGEEKQEALKKARVFVAGVGGLGCPGSLYLAVAGVGRLKIVDKECIDPTNLNRQILHWNKDIGRLKIASALEKLKEINPYIEVEGISEEITQENAPLLLKDCDAIFDGMDSFKTRFILNKVAFEQKIPFFHASIYGLEGRVTTIIPGRTVCLQCIFKEDPPKEIFPVLGTTPALVAIIQATEIIKYFTGEGKLLENRYIIYNASTMTFREIRLKKDPNCTICNDIRDSHLLG